MKAIALRLLLPLAAASASPDSPECELDDESSMMQNMNGVLFSVLADEFETQEFSLAQVQQPRFVITLPASGGQGGGTSPDQQSAGSTVIRIELPAERPVQPLPPQPAPQQLVPPDQASQPSLVEDQKLEVAQVSPAQPAIQQEPPAAAPTAQAQAFAAAVQQPLTEDNVQLQVVAPVTQPQLGQDPAVAPKSQQLQPVSQQSEGQPQQVEPVESTPTMEAVRQEPQSLAASQLGVVPQQPAALQPPLLPPPPPPQQPQRQPAAPPQQPRDQQPQPVPEQPQLSLQLPLQPQALQRPPYVPQQPQLSEPQLPQQQFEQPVQTQAWPAQAQPQQASSYSVASRAVPDAPIAPPQPTSQGPRLTPVAPHGDDADAVTALPVKAAAPEAPAQAPTAPAPAPVHTVAPIGRLDILQTPWMAIHFPRVWRLFQVLTFGLVVKVLCMLGNVLVQLSPLPQAFSWAKLRSTGEADSAPYLSICFTGWQWCFYGTFAYFVTDRSGFLILLYSNFLGAGLGTYYVTVFYRNCSSASSRATLQKYLSAVLAMVLLQLCGLLSLPKERSLFLSGAVSSSCSFMGAFSVLVTVPGALASQDASSIPGTLVSANFGSSVCWLICGHMLRDPMIMGPNLACIASNGLCIFLKLRYGRGKKDADSEPAACGNFGPLSAASAVAYRRKLAAAALAPTPATPSTGAAQVHKFAASEEPHGSLAAPHCDGTGGTF